MLYSVREPEKVVPGVGRLAGEEMGESLQLVRYYATVVGRMQKYCIEIRRNADGWMSMSVYERDTG